MVGIPATILGALLLPVSLMLASLPIFSLSVGLFVGGYIVQFAGHLIERSEPGELIVARKLWNRRRWVSVPPSPAKTGQSVV
jgi:hypothetical protein